MTDAKILGQIGSLLSRYGVSDEEKQNFLNDLKDYKDDEEEKAPEEQPTNDEVGEEKPTDDETPVEEKIETTEEEKVEESTDDPKPEEAQAEEQVVEADEEVGSEETVEDKVEEKVDETQPQEPKEEYDYKGKYDELLKANEGLAARIAALEDIVSKIGVPTEEEQFGKSPNAEASEEEHDDFITELNRKRMGY